MGGVGYSRILLAALSMHFMNYHPKYSTLAYAVSQLLDAVDGHAARALGQASKFGAVLDMVTDRYAYFSHLFRSGVADHLLGRLRLVCCVIFPRPIPRMRSCSSSLSLWILVAIISTCTGEYTQHANTEDSPDAAQFTCDRLPQSQISYQ